MSGYSGQEHFDQQDSYLYGNRTSRPTIHNTSTTDFAKIKTAITTTPPSTSKITQSVAGKTTTLYRKPSVTHPSIHFLRLTHTACATPLPSSIPTIPYGDAQSLTDLNTANQLYDLSTPEGASAEACCNACYFGLSNCIQAYWYFYQGCVVQQANVEGSGIGVSSSCPSGLFDGLAYVPDTSPAFRSTGDFAGPCGVRYENL